MTEETPTEEVSRIVLSETECQWIVFALASLVNDEVRLEEAIEDVALCDPTGDPTELLRLKEFGGALTSAPSSEQLQEIIDKFAD